MTNTERQIEVLQKQLEQEKEDALFLSNAKTLLEGKYFLDETNDYHYKSRGRFLNLMFVNSIKEYSNGDFVFDGLAFSLYANPTKIIKSNSFSSNLTAQFANIDITANKWFTRFKSFNRNKTNITLKEGCVEITKEKAIYILSSLIDIQNEVYNKLENLFVSTKEVVEDSVVINFQDLKDFKNIDLFLKNNPIPIKEIKPKYKSIIQNRFNSRYELEELVQYDLKGESGLYLNIVGGDDGTDYEPYVTHYYIEEVKIKWEEILYPIRLKLNCKVFELVEELDSIKGVYSIGNWDVNYSGSYDVDFNRASLSRTMVSEINNVIKKHLI